MKDRRRPHFVAMLFAALLVLTSYGAELTIADDPLKKTAAEKGFVSLFDGKSLDGWHIMNAGKFKAEDGVIKLEGGRGWLRSDKEYADFVLRLEVRWMKPKQDSGVFLRASEEGKNWPSRRYEVQCENSERIARLFGASHQRDVQTAFNALNGKLGEWNSFEIHCQGPNVTVWLNGTEVTTSDSLKHLDGYIGLQGEGGWLEFRNIRVKSLIATN